ncbi:MAG TPA: hypothetical protein PLU39_19320, partial [Armatimonadota bacterium]|nr:hypothetical protein [Armatimonadota bacterium]
MRVWGRRPVQRRRYWLTWAERRMHCHPGVGELAALAGGCMRPEAGNRFTQERGSVGWGPDGRPSDNSDGRR